MILKSRRSAGKSNEESVGKPVVFASGVEQVVGMLHMPAIAKKKPVPAVVLLHGFSGNKVERHRIFVKTARALAGSGIAALRFDFRGAGDSGGDFSTTTMSTEVEDAKVALKFLRRQSGIDPSRIGVLGLSMGGLVAARMLGDDRRLVAGVLWNAVSDPVRQVKARMKPEARRILKEMGCVDDRGTAIGKDFFADIKSHRPLRDIRNTRAAVLVIQAGKDETVDPIAADEYEAALKKAGKPFAKHIVKGANHTFDSLAWETQVIGLTLEWFRCQMACSHC